MFSKMLTGRIDQEDPRAEMGRFGDNRMAHVEDGEMIIPKMMLEKFPSLREMIMGAFEEMGTSPKSYTVGEGEANVNPETGEEEFNPAAIMMGLSTGASLLGNMLDRKDTKRANEAAQRGIAEARQEISPYSEIGLGGMKDYASRIGEGFDYDDYKNSEGYNFALNEGLDAIDTKLNTMGLRSSGAAAKEGARYAQGLASQDYADAYQRWLADNSQFAGLGNMGLGAAQGLANLASRSGQTEGQMNMANASNRNQMLGGLMNLAGTLYAPKLSSFLGGRGE